MKQILLLTSFFSLAHAMELNFLVPVGAQHEAEVNVNRHERQLVRSYETHEMSWLLRLYLASGFKQRMSREFFCVNALAKIQESIANARCYPGLHAWSGDELGMEGCGLLLKGAFYGGSALALIITFCIGVSGPDKPWKFPEQIVQGACAKAKLIFNDTWGLDQVHGCMSQSSEFDIPCNYTRLGSMRGSFCCYDKYDPLCYQRGLNYNKEIYPILHSQAVRECWKPFVIDASIMAGLTLSAIGYYKLRRCLKQKRQLSLSHAIPMLEQVEVTASEDV